MREQLIQYIDLLFAGIPGSEDIKQEILQNTLDRYDDLTAQGKAPEAAYRLAISGIGDINEILGTSSQPYVAAASANHQNHQPESAEEIKRKKLRANGIVLYILSAIPLIVLSELGYDILGLALTIIMVAAATYNMIVTGRKDEDVDDEKEEKKPASSKSELKKSIEKLIFAIGLVAYLAISFSTGAWYITWVIFPIMACLEGLVNAIIDLKGVISNET